MSSSLGFGQIVVDCEDPPRLAGFWSDFLGRPIESGASDYFAMIGASADRSFPALMFLKVPEPRSGKNRWHIDLVAQDRSAEAERAVSLGATRLGDFDEYSAKWTTLADPEGNLFDIGAAR